MKLDQLQHLVGIVEHGGLRAAARRLGMPQPALTRSIRSLEKELGCTLFRRETSGMTLTPLGDLFHRRASAVVQEVRRARDELGQQLGQTQGTVIAALSIMPHVGMLPRALPAFRQRFPDVHARTDRGPVPRGRGTAAQRSHRLLPGRCAARRGGGGPRRHAAVRQLPYRGVPQGPPARSLALTEGAGRARAGP